MEVFKIRGKIGDGLTDMENLRYSLKTLSLRLSNIFLKGISKRGFEKRFLGTMDISSYMQSEQARLAGKHLTRLSKNGIAAVTYIATLLRGPPKFLLGSATAAMVAGFVLSACT